MKKKARSAIGVIVSLMLSVSLVVLGGCGGGGNAAKDTLTGTTAALMTQLMEKAKTKLSSGEEFPMTFDDAVTSDKSEFILGLTSAQFGQYVTEATASTAAIATFAYQVALVKCKSIKDAETVVGLIAAGFNPMRWVCVSPEQCFVQQSGSYVLLVASSKTQAEALRAAFSDLAGGNVGTANTFYTFAG